MKSGTRPKRRIDAYTENGIDYRWRYTFKDLSLAFRATPLAYFFTNLFTERNEYADVQTIIHQFPWRRYFVVSGNCT